MKRLATLLVCLSLSGCAPLLAMMGSPSLPQPVAQQVGSTALAVRKAIVAAKTADLMAWKLAEVLLDQKLASADTLRKINRLLDGADNALAMADQAADLGDYVAALGKVQDANKLANDARALAP